MMRANFDRWWAVEKYSAGYDEAKDAWNFQQLHIDHLQNKVKELEDAIKKIYEHNNGNGYAHYHEHMINQIIKETLCTKFPQC